ncbi:MAG: hypothetical protein RL212_91 [Pseudomonadota bacterium]
MKSPTFSLRTRLLVWILGSIFLIWTVTALFVWLDAKSELEEIFDKLASNRMSLYKLTHEKEELLRDLLWGLIWPMLVGLPILAIIVSGVIVWSNRSLQKLSAAISDRSVNSLEPIQVDALPKELVPVLGELNTLLMKMGHVLEQEKRFTSDAAHELRTPLAAIRTQAEVLRFDKVLNQDSVNNLIESCDRSSRVIEQLLALARLESATNPFVKTEFNLSEFVRKQIANTYHLVDQKHQTIELLEEGGFHVSANEDLLGILLRNLLDNAIRYSPIKGKIDISINQKHDAVYLTIEDSGPGLSDGEIKRLGERFLRMSSSDTSGTGLGWSIIKKIADVDGLAVQVNKATELGGLSVTIRFKLARNA